MITNILIINIINSYSDFYLIFTIEVAPCPYKVNQVDRSKFSVSGLAPFQTCRTPGYFDDTNAHCRCFYTGYRL